jgi:Protein of unknown function (DUF2845)
VTNQTVSMASGARQAAGFNSRSTEGVSGARNSSSPWAALVLAVLAVGCLPGLASAGMRCGSRIIDRGTSSAEVTSFCGAPAQVDRTTAYRNGATTVDGNGRVTGIGADVQIEFWTYNFGPNQLMERVRIEDGVVVDVQSLGYGFNEP